MMTFLLALWAARLTAWAIRFLNKGGATSFPGGIAAKIDPSILSRFASQLPQGVILVSGTNGKTSVASLLAQVLSGDGKKVIHNKSGANLTAGIIVAFIQKANFWGQLNADCAVLEVDEAAFLNIAHQLQPHTVLLTNLFPDQLDRYGDQEKVVQLISEGLKRLKKGSRVILNGDDTLLLSLQTDNDLNLSYYCLAEGQTALRQLSSDTKTLLCPHCGNALEYSENYYAHLGKFSCKNCGCHNPVCDYQSSHIELLGLEGSSFTLSSPQGEVKIKTDRPGLYNVYNMLSVFGAASSLEVDLKVIASTLENYLGTFGRMEKIELEDKKVIMVLAKNTAGFNQVFTTLQPQKDKFRLLLAVNDHPADGADISWLWDVEFEKADLSLYNVPLYLSGNRAYALQLRLAYTGLSADELVMEKDVALCFESALNRLKKDETLIVLINYSAMLELQNYWIEKKIVKPYWEAAK